MTDGYGDAAMGGMGCEQDGVYHEIREREHRRRNRI